MIMLGIGEAMLALVILVIWYADARPKVKAIRDVLQEMKKMADE